MNLPNKLTVLRVIMVPFFVFFMLTDVGGPANKWIALVLFCVASLTDMLDGKIARARNLVTNFGKFMDPLADKLLVTAALISLVEFRVVPSWAAVIIIAREFAVSGLRTIAASEGKVIAASWWGKIKTVIQIVAIILLLIEVNISQSKYLFDLVTNSNFLMNFFEYVPRISLDIAVIITIVSGYDYFRKNKGIISTNK